MSGKASVKADALPDLDDLLQCPVCYEIPSGQIFQCNEGHHVCGRCKVRLDVCPVCRALFFGTRNYAMEELIANVRKLRAFKLGGKITTGPGSSECCTPVPETVPDESENATNADDNEEDLQVSNRSTVRPPQPCKGLFRCLCCKNGNAERFPAGRLLNHLRYFHASELIEGQSENGEYIQAWQFNTNPGRITTAVRVSDMGVFFLTIDITSLSVCAWLKMAASPWVAHEFSYTLTISGNDREAIFSDCVWSVKSCEGYLRKHGHCLLVEGSDAHAFISSAFMFSGKLVIRRLPSGLLTQQTQPRAVMRVASRGADRGTTHVSTSIELEPLINDLHDGMARLTRAFASLNRDTSSSARSDTEHSTRVQNTLNPAPSTAQNVAADVNSQPTTNGSSANVENIPATRASRRRRRQMLMSTLVEDETQPESDQSRQVVPQQENTNRNRVQNNSNVNNQVILLSGLAVVQQNSAPSAAVNPQIRSGASNGRTDNTHNVRVNKKNRRHRR